MKILKALMLSLLVVFSLNVFAEGDASAVGEHANGCGPNSTCSECVNQSTGADDAAVAGSVEEDETGTVETR